MDLSARPYLQRITALFGDDVDWNRHPYCVPAVRALSSLDFHPDVTFFVGENGAGKSTLLEAIALALMDEYYERSASRPDSFHARSHGEAFMSVLLNTFRGHGLYLLDEPEAALSPNRQMAALSVIHQLVKQDSQFIIATHSPILLAYPNAKILLFDGTGISEVAYEDTEHYAVTRDFLNHYPRRLEQLFESDG